MPVQGLPSSGSRTQANQMKAWFQKFVLQRSQDNWKYWIVSFLMKQNILIYPEFVIAKAFEGIELLRLVL